MGFRFPDPKPQFRDNAGAICANGTLTFYVNETSTPKNVYDGPDLGTSIGNTVTLDAAGRTEDDVWLDGVYRVKLETEDATEVWTLDDVRDIDATAVVAVPDPSTGTDGQVLHTDGVEYYFDDILQVPDCTGQSGKVLGNDGDVPIWQTQPPLPAGGVSQTSGKVIIGDEMILRGTGTATAASSQTITASVTFATAFGATPVVVISPQVGAVTGESGGVEAHAVNVTTTGFTATFIAPDMGSVPGSENITSNVSFGYIAMGEAP